MLLPIALVVATLMLIGGMPMTFQGSAVATTLEGAQQIIARGPVAAFLTIKQLGTNGGGWFGPNSTHPFENPTFWTNALSMICIILIPMACVWMFGRIVGRMRHAAVVFAVMLALVLTRIVFAIWFETAPTEAFAQLPIEQNVGNLEGKELRFGATSGPTWAVITTSTSNGSVGAMHDSLNPLTGLMPMIGMWLNEDFGGVGVGMINMFLYIMVAVFIAGMMVGRTPEYLGWRVESREVKFAILALLAHGFFILVGTAIFAATPGAPRPSTISARMGSARCSTSSARPVPTTDLASRVSATIPCRGTSRPASSCCSPASFPIILPLAIVGSLMTKRRSAESAGTLGVEDGTFAGMLLVTILIVGALTFFPAATLGPVAEHFIYMVK